MCPIFQKQRKQLMHTFDPFLNFVKFTLKAQLRILTCFCDEEVQSSQAMCMTLVVVSWEELGRLTQFIRTICTDLQLCLK